MKIYAFDYLIVNEFNDGRSHEKEQTLEVDDKLVGFSI